MARVCPGLVVSSGPPYLRRCRLTKLNIQGWCAKHGAQREAQARLLAALMPGWEVILAGKRQEPLPVSAEEGGETSTLDAEFDFESLWKDAFPSVDPG